MESFWWGLMALTTVGNGEKAPSTLVGKVKFLYAHAALTPRSRRALAGLSPRSHRALATLSTGSRHALATL